MVAELAPETVNLPLPAGYRASVCGNTKTALELYGINRSIHHE